MSGSKGGRSRAEMRYSKLKVVLAGLLLALCASAAQADDELRRQLLELGARDQSEMNRDEGPRVEKLEAMVTELKALVAKHGWPRRSEVGAEAEHAAWIVAQHADTDREFQRFALAQIEARVAEGEALPRFVGFLVDRLERAEGRLQVYGTQGGCEGGRWRAFPSIEPETLEARRAELGMETLADYEAMGSQFCAAPSP